MFHKLSAKGSKLCGKMLLSKGYHGSDHFQGVFRGFLGAGEAICFGLDSIAVPYVKEAGVIFAFYTSGVLVFVYLAAFHIKETKYFTGEDGVVIPKHVLDEHAQEGGVVEFGEETQGTSVEGDEKTISAK